MNKITLGVLFGGVSSEHDISTVSAKGILSAIDKEKYDSLGDFELVDELSKLSKVKVPQAIEDIRTAPVLHDTICDVDKMCDNVKRILHI